MSVSSVLDFDLDAVPVDAFDLSDSGLVESLTSEHGAKVYGCSGGCVSCTTFVSE
jgi:G3E family GTPase